MNGIDMRKKYVLFYLLVLILFSCQKLDTNHLTRTDKKSLLELVNAIRKNGCNCGDKYMPAVAPVSWNNKLEHAAQQHSIDMAENDFFSHQGSDGSSAGDRISEQGYKWISWGENIYYESNFSPDAPASNAFNAWLNSPAHCKNMMNPDFTEMGASKSITKDAMAYWTQDFARPQKK